MLIEIDGYFNQTVLSTEEDLSEREIREFYEQLKNEGISWVELSELFCNRFNMKIEEKIDGIRIDIVIDTDTDRIYKPYY